MIEGGRRKGKRGDGEGSIRWSEGKELWVARLMVGYRPDGKPDIREVAAKSRGDCQKKLDDLRKRASGGLLTDAEKARDTVAAFLMRWVDATKASVRPNTHKRYEEIVRLHLSPGLGRHKLSALKPDHVQRFYADKMGSKLSPRTVHHCHRVLHRALQMAVRWGYVPRNVCQAVEAPKVPRREIVPPTAQQIDRLLTSAEAHGDRLGVLWSVAFYSGCRQGELLGLQWTDLDLAGGMLTVRRTLTKATRGVPSYGEPKSATSRRTVKLAADAVDALRAHRDRQNFDRSKLGDAYAPYNLVFATALGTAFNNSEVCHRFKDALERAKLPRSIRFHDLRHASATAMLDAGIHPKSASARLGHSTIGITMDLYTHAMQELDADAADKLGEVLRRVRTAR